MGAKASKSKDKKPRPIRILFEGLHESGRTSLWYQLKHGKVISPDYPKMGEMFEKMTVDGIDLISMDLTGRGRFRPFRVVHYRFSQAIVYVIDSTNVEKIDEALEELDIYNLQEDATENQVLMVLANKIDLEGAVSLKELEEKVRDLTSRHCPDLGGRCVFVKDCSAVTREGLEEAFSLFLLAIKYLQEGKITPGFTTFSSLQDKINAIKEKAEVEVQVAEQKKPSGTIFMDKLSHVPILKSILFR